jgi:hypothetical protein
MSMRLLDKVCYLSRATSKDKDLFGNEITVRHTFPYNPDSKTAPKTASRWADMTTWDYKTNKKIKGPKPEFLERANEPFSVTIINLDIRTQGGRAYKVIDAENRCFDLREDQVLEVFKRSGVLAGGQIPGQFVWGILGSQMRMVLVGGNIHKEMVEATEALNDFSHKQASGQAPTESSLQFGHIYQKRDKSLHLFLGRVKVPGSTKASFAFVKLPTSPPIYDHIRTDDLDRYDGIHGEHMREERAIAQRWESMTWQERCQWDWFASNEYLYRQYKDVTPGYYDRPAKIVLMSSPKFEVEASGPEFGLAEQLKVNIASKHKYVDGNDNDLAEIRWQKDHNNGQPREWNCNGFHDPEWFAMNEFKRQKRVNEVYERARKEYASCQAQFQKELVWL